MNDNFEGFLKLRWKKIWLGPYSSEFFVLNQNFKIFWKIFNSFSFSFHWMIFRFRTNRKHKLDAELCRNVVCNHPFQQCQVDENGRSGCVCSIRSICQENGVNNSSLWKVPSSITSVNKEPGNVSAYRRNLSNLFPIFSA